jgi:hypothetical protein
MAMSKFTKHNATMYPFMRENPPIPFIPKSKKVKSELTEADKTELITFDFFVDPENSATKFSKEFLIFKDGDPEDWIKWLMGYRNLEMMMPLREPCDKSKMLRTLLKGMALSQFEHHLRKRLGVEDIELPDHDFLELVIRDVGLEYISRRAIRAQKYYMRRFLFMGPSVSVQQFVERLNEMNRYLLYFPEEFPTQLDQDEMFEILDQSKSPEWHAAMILANIDIFEMNYEEAISYFKRLKNLEKICLTNGPAPNTTVDNKKSVTSSVGVGKV